MSNCFYTSGFQEEDNDSLLYLLPRGKRKNVWILYETQQTLANEKKDFQSQKVKNSTCVYQVGMREHLVSFGMMKGQRISRQSFS